MMDLINMNGLIVFVDAMADSCKRRAIGIGSAQGWFAANKTVAVSGTGRGGGRATGE
jgi:hypothetical protein